MRLPALCALLTLCLLACPSARAASDREVERAVLGELGRVLPAGAPGGVAVAVRTAGRTLLFNYGRADLAGERAITSDTLFNLGSLGKVFDTTLLADAAKRGEIGLDDPIAKYVPELADGGDIRRITFAQLATYTAGLVLAQDHPPWPKDAFSKPDFLAVLARWSADADHQPGRQLIYSHAGFELLHLAFERRFNMPLREILQQRVLAPLGLSSTLLPVPAADPQTNPRGELPAGLVARAVQGFSDEGEPVGAPGNLQGYYHWLGAGQMYSSARDMVEFLAANMGERPDHPALQAAMRLAQRGVFSESKAATQAMAWVVHHVDVEIVDKFGGLNNASAYIGLAPKAKTGIVILTNRGSQPLGSVGRAILRELTRKVVARR